MTDPIRLVIADDHPIVLDGLTRLFEAEPGFCIVGTATSGPGTLAAVRAYRPDILVLDLRMPELDGLGVVRALDAAGSRPRVVVLTAAASNEALEAIRMGVEGVVLKDMATDLLVRCVRTVYAGDKWIEKALATRALDAAHARHAAERELTAQLTPRELEVARLIAQGFTTKVVAAKLAISEGTAKLHLHHVYQKLELEGRVALVHHLRAKGLL